MSRIILKMSISVDGFVAGPNGELDWVFKNSTPTSAAWVADRISGAGAHLMGRKTFQTMSAFWPTASGPFAKPMNEIPKIVFSKAGFELLKVATTASLPETAKNWVNPQVLTGDLTEEIAKLKKRTGKDLVAHGGASFARSLLDTGLVDEICLVVCPVALGQGLPLFSELKSPLNLKLATSKVFEQGIVANVYNVG